METRFIKKGRLLWQIILAVCLVVSTLWIGVVPVAAAGPTPTPSSCTPNSGPAAGGTIVTIAGGGLGGGGAITVTFGGVTAINPTRPGTSPATIICTTPAHAAGAVDVVVTIAGAGPPDSGTITSGFTYTGGTAPIVARFNEPPDAPVLD